MVTSPARFDLANEVRAILRDDPKPAEAAEAVKELMRFAFARHVTTIDDALETFFGGQTVWNSERERFETYSQTHGLFWFRIEENKVVMVISCFRL